MPTQVKIPQQNKKALFKFVIPSTEQPHSKLSEKSVGNDVPAFNETFNFSKPEAGQGAYQDRHEIEKAAIALEVQERERNAIGMELHDNVNQILVSTKLMLSAVETVAPGDEGLLATCIDNLQQAIDENRKISHEMVAPDFKEQKLTEQIESIVHSMLQPTGAGVKVDYPSLDENMLQPQQKLAIYRIVQEQCTNITKHAGAKKVEITLSTNASKFYMKITDDGKGIQPDKKVNGIGIKNIYNRLTVLHGSANIYSEPGKGFTLEIEMPLAGYFPSPCQIQLKCLIS